MKGTEEGRSVWMEKVNTKAVKILEVLSVLVIVMAQGCEEGRMEWGTGWRGFWQLMMQSRAEEKLGPYLTGPGLFCTMVNHAKWTRGPWFSVYLGLGPGYGVGLVYHSTPVRSECPSIRVLVKRTTSCYDQKNITVSRRDLPFFTQKENVSTSEDQDTYIEFYFSTRKNICINENDPFPSTIIVNKQINVELSRKKATADNYSNNDNIDETRKCQIAIYCISFQCCCQPPIYNIRRSFE